VSAMPALSVGAQIHLLPCEMKHGGDGLVAIFVPPVAAVFTVKLPVEASVKFVVIKELRSRVGEPSTPRIRLAGTQRCPGNDTPSLFACNPLCRHWQCW
jgi:hypothetical protein